MRVESSNGVTSVYLDVKEFGGRIYLFSDVHFDSMYCNRDLLEKHLKQALDENAVILDGGDFFDAMQGRYDPRRSMGSLRPEYLRDDYYDFVVKDAFEFLRPYAKNMIMMAPGNHELSVVKNANTNLTERLTYLMRISGFQTVTGWFKGYVRFIFSTNGKHINSVLIRYSHSGGGNFAPVTRGVIETARQMYIADADVVWNGHNHQGWIMPRTRERISPRGKIYSDILWFVRTPGYKDEYMLNHDGFEAQRAFGPNLNGCIVLNVSFSDFRAHVKPEVLFDTHLSLNEYRFNDVVVDNFEAGYLAESFTD